jgi:C4-type Zn-finger protein
MPCPVCRAELDQELEVPGGVWGNLLMSELTCANCGSKIGMLQEIEPPRVPDVQADA